MQGLIEKRAKARERAQRWRANNVERAKEMKRNYRLKQRGIDPTEPKEYRAISTDNFGLRSAEPEKPIEVSLCECGRKYLTKLHCLWCTDYSN